MLAQPPIVWRLLQTGPPVVSFNLEGSSRRLGDPELDLSVILMPGMPQARWIALGFGTRAYWVGGVG